MRGMEKIEYVPRLAMREEAKLETAT